MWSLSTIVLVLFVLQSNSETVKREESRRPAMSIGAPAQMINGNHISLQFYAALKDGHKRKSNLQFVLQNFVENLQKNLTTSSILNTIVSGMDMKNKQSQIERIYNLADYFEYSSDMAKAFAGAAEHFLELSANESVAILQKIRLIPSGQHYLTSAVKMHLTDYFNEMEFFHVMFSEVIDEALEYVVDTLRFVQNIFMRFADVQREVIRTWNIRMDEWCCNAYIDFLQLWSTEIFKCASTTDLQIAYDVYAITETTTKYIMRQLEFRIQRLYNCFIFGGYQLRCKFLLSPEQDFQPLFSKLDELQQYFDIRIKGGRVTVFRTRRRSTEHTSERDYDNCLPPGFPEMQMRNKLKNCFHLQIY